MADEAELEAIGALGALAGGVGGQHDMHQQVHEVLSHPVRHCI